MTESRKRVVLLSSMTDSTPHAGHVTMHELLYGSSLSIQTLIRLGSNGAFRDYMPYFQFTWTLLAINA